MRQAKSVLTQYIPIKQTLSLFHCESMWDQYKQVHSSIGSKDIFQDVWDGRELIIELNPISGCI